MTNLPPELTDYILDFLYDDKPSLADCSLVCRSWLSTSSRYLFSDLRLGHRELGPDVPFDWFERFLIDIQASPRIRRHVQSITFHSHSSDARLGCSLRVLQHIIASFSQLESLEMSYLNISSDVSPYALSLPPITTQLRLRTIVIRNVLDFITYRGMVTEAGTVESTGLAEFLDVFQEVGELSMDNAALPFIFPFTWPLLEAIPIAIPIRRRVHIEEIHLTGYQAARMLGVLGSATEPTALKGLSVELSPRILPLVNWFMGGRTNVESLYFSFRRGFPGSA